MTMLHAQAMAWLMNSLTFVPMPTSHSSHKYNEAMPPGPALPHQACLLLALDAAAYPPCAKMSCCCHMSSRERARFRCPWLLLLLLGMFAL